MTKISRFTVVVQVEQNSGPNVFPQFFILKNLVYSETCHFWQ